jgi:hypothetical protein
MKTKEAGKAFSNKLKKEKNLHPKFTSYKMDAEKNMSSLLDKGIYDQEDEFICIRSTN